MTAMTLESATVRTRIRIMQRLAADLERIRTGHSPTAEELAAAPIMEDWRLVPHAGLALKGTVASLAPGNLTSSEVYILDPAARYARTFTRLYRLGREGRN